MRQCSGREGSEGAGWGWREGGRLSTGRGARGEAGARDEALNWILRKCEFACEKGISEVAWIEWSFWRSVYRWTKKDTKSATSLSQYSFAA